MLIHYSFNYNFDKRLKFNFYMYQNSQKKTDLYEKVYFSLKKSKIKFHN